MKIINMEMFVVRLKEMKRIKALLIFCCLIFALVLLGNASAETTYAKSVKQISKSAKIVCNESAKIKLPKGYTNCKYSSSNPKVATVNSKGQIKALRLGVTNITVKSGKKSKRYTITVVPKNKNDVWLNQELILKYQKVHFTLVSDKYDTSQVKLNFDDYSDDVDNKGNWKWNRDWEDCYMGWTSMDYGYGSFHKQSKIHICDPEALFSNILSLGYNDSVGINAGEIYTPSVKLMGERTFSLEEIKRMGVTITLDGLPMPEEVVFEPGKHVLCLETPNQKYEKEFCVKYSIRDTLLRKDATGYSEDCKAVFEAAFAIVNEYITPDMSDEQKVKAIHDYLIYNANYVNNGNYETAENWAYGAGGVLLHKEGVCQSYAFAFYMMTTSAGMDCRVVTGTAKGGGHAWNQIKVDDKWYYIDCTWDDPVGGGYECYTYYLSETGWSDHVVNEVKDLAEEGTWSWENFYLTGEKYARNAL